MGAIVLKACFRPKFVELLATVIGTQMVVDPPGVKLVLISLDEPEAVMSLVPAALAAVSVVPVEEMIGQVEFAQVEQVTVGVFT